MSKKISLITTTRDRPHMLLECAKSIIYQDHLPYEWILLIDDEWQQYQEVLSSIRDVASSKHFWNRIQICTPGNLGRNEALRFAHNKATGDYIAWVDDDDWLHSKCLSVVKGIDSELIYTNHYQYYQHDSKQGELKLSPCHNIDYSWEALTKNSIMLHLVMYSKDLYDRVGGIDPEVKGGIDYDLYLRMAKKIQPLEPVKVQEPLYYYRIHSDRISTKKRKLQQEGFKRAVKLYG